MRALAWDEPLVWVTWKVVAVPARASFHETVKVTPFWVAVAEWAWVVCGVAEIASGAGLAWARRDGAGAVVAAPVAAVVSGVAASAALAAVVPPALSVLTALVPVDVAVLSSTVSAVAFVLVPVSALSVSLFVASACVCCSAVAGGWMASAMAAMGIVAPTMDVHAIAQSR